MVYRCRAQTSDGTLCRNRVRVADTRCHLHQGRPGGRVPTPRPQRPSVPAPRSTAPPAARTGAGTGRPAPGRTTGRSSPDQRLTQAVDFCLDTLSDGGVSTIADRASAYVTDRSWDALVRQHRRKDCDDLAQLARRILLGKEQIHEFLGRSAGSLLGFFGRPRIERIFVQEVVSRIPLPFDVKLSAAARALQIAGIYVCLVGGRGLAGCACLKDVLKVEGQAQVQKLILGSIQDWKELPTRLNG
jgi:hypothetical protein